MRRTSRLPRILLATALSVSSGSSLALDLSSLDRPTPRLDPAFASDAPAAAPPPTSLWEQLRQGFAMPDCLHDAEVDGIARSFTRNTSLFEEQLRTGLPRLAYIQPQMAANGLPAEFALLPWVESHYQPVLHNRKRPVGMWQIMPVTAQSMGLKVNHAYEGRLDIKASTTAITKLLQHYHDELHDWRLVDYAFNSGESLIQQTLNRKGSPPAQPLLPAYPVSAYTRRHLGKLLAIACVIRHPARYGVDLPQLPSRKKLETVTLSHSMPVAKAAERAGMTPQEFKEWNGAFLGTLVDPRQTRTLLLPQQNAEQWRQLAPTSGPGNADLVGSPELIDNRDFLAAAPTHHHSHPAKRQRYRVTRGDTLWSVARRHHVTLAELQRWNRLSKPVVRPGQMLLVSPPSN